MGVTEQFKLSGTRPVSGGYALGSDGRAGYHGPEVLRSGMARWDDLRCRRPHCAPTTHRPSSGN